MSRDWSKSEVNTIVADYFAMLEAEIRGQPYNKTAHRRTIRRQLTARSDGSVERKHQNISAIMLELGIPYIAGYKPLRNYQRTLLPGAVLSYLDAHPETARLLEADVTAETAVPDVDDILRALDEPPDHRSTLDHGEVWERPQPSRLSVDYIQQEARNQRLGYAGELFAINFEKARLIRAGRESLAERIEHTSHEIGDRAGYDIHSYNETGTDRFIEAKTTRYGKETPFYVTRNEVVFSETHADHYWLYRIFQFRNSPRLYLASGDLRNRFTLRPDSYMATA